jgi:hypothetical protein
MESGDEDTIVAQEDVAVIFDNMQTIADFLVEKLGPPERRKLLESGKVLEIDADTVEVGKVKKEDLRVLNEEMTSMKEEMKTEVAGMKEGIGDIAKMMREILKAKMVNAETQDSDR